MRPSLAPSVTALREAAAVWKRAGDSLFAESEDLLAKATACYAKEREALEQADEAEETEAAKEWLGPKVVARKERVA